VQSRAVNSIEHGVGLDLDQHVSLEENLDTDPWQSSTA
jgi:hypothetical protein